MLRTRALCCLSCALLLSVVFDSKAEEPLKNVAQTNVARIEQALDGPARFQFVDRPLKDALVALSRKHNIPITLDRSYLEDTGSQLTYEAGQYETLRGALNRALRNNGYRAIVRNETLTVTVRDVEEESLELESYSLAGVPPVAGEPFVYYPYVTPQGDFICGNSLMDFYPRDSLESVLNDFVYCSMQCVENRLWVRATQAQHRRLAAVLRTMKSFAQIDPDRGVPSPAFVPVTESAATERVFAALRTPTTIDFWEVPLDAAVKQLEARCQVAIRLAPHLSREYKISTTRMLVTMNARNTPLAAILRALIQDSRMSWCIDEDCILITGASDASELSTIGLHYVADLVRVESPDGASRLDTQPLIDCVTQGVSPGTWRTHSGIGRCLPCGSCLIVANTPLVHIEVDRFLQELRKQQAKRPPLGIHRATPVTRLYHLWRVRADETVAVPTDETAGIVADIQRLVAPDSWHDAGGNNTIKVVAGVLVVRAPMDIQAELQTLLQTMRVWNPQGPKSIVGSGIF